jgi:hypothetical protein
MQIKITNQNGAEFPIGNITFISNKTFNGKVGGHVEVHGTHISEGFYDVKALNMHIHVIDQHAASTLWNFTLEHFIEP